MIDYASSGARATSRDARSTSSASCAGSTGCCCSRSRALVAFGLWAVAGITRFDVEGNENYYVVRQAIAAGLGFAGFLVALAIDPDRYRRAQKAHLRRHDRADAARLPARRHDARVEALDRARPVPVPAVRVRQAPLRARARRLPRRPRAPARRAAGSSLQTVGLAPCRSCSSSCSRTSARRSSTSAALDGLPVRRRRALDAPRRAHLARRARRRERRLVPARRRASTCSKPYQIDRLTGFANPDSDLGRRDLQRQPVDHRGRLGRLDGRGVERRHADPARLPARARDRLRLRVARRAARLLRRGAPARPLPARRLARSARDRGRARPVQGDRGGRDRDRVPLPGLRQRRHDDGHRAGDGHPAARS